MLNELLIAERGARQAGLSDELDKAQLHEDVKECGRVPTLLVRLATDGRLVSVRPVPPERKPWTIRDGQNNSFPFVSLPNLPLLNVAVDDERRKRVVDRRNDRRRAALLTLADEVDLQADGFDDWPGEGLMSRLRERRQQLSALDGSDMNVVPATIDRFLRACDSTLGGDPQRLLHSVGKQLVSELRQGAGEDWLEVAVALLMGKFNAKNGKWERSGALLFEADGSQVSIVNQEVAIRVSTVLSMAQQIGVGGVQAGICGLTGDEGILLSGNFPQPNLPRLGQTFLFAKNKDIPANDRYGRFAAEAMPVGHDTASRLRAAIKVLTADERLNVTWHAIPGEARKQTDLLLAFVEAVPDAPVAGMLAGDEEDEDYSEETPASESSSAESIATFEKRTERLVHSIKGRISADFRQTPVQLTIFRKVDPANRKVVYGGAPTVAELYDAALSWAAGERNLPPWLALSVLRKGSSKPVPMTPPHIAPLGVIPFSKYFFSHGGTQQQEAIGLPATEALCLFLQGPDNRGFQARKRSARILHLTLSRRAMLIVGLSQAHHSPECWRDRKKAIAKFKDREALRTVTMLGLLLHKLGRTKEVYMSDMAFKLGQLLAAADIVHAGYCADVRGGAIPPSLLGNQVFTMAQAAPAKALATLCRRWKPYDGWAKKAARQPDRIGQMVASKKAEEQQRGWDIRRALRHAREMGPLADDLRSSLVGCEINDAFRAELLLGYIAGPPKAQRGSAVDTNQATLSSEQEE
jgi:hypothetical protein